MNIFFAILIWLTATVLLALNQYANMYLPYKNGIIAKRLLILTTAVSIAVDLFIIWAIHYNLFQ